MAIFNTSRFIKKDALVEPVELTIKAEPVKENVGTVEKPQSKHVCYFDEIEEGLVLNATRGNAICDLHGKDMAKWVGKKITVFNDASVSFAGKRVGGVGVK